jgi:aryl-alcohol dehydrogenase-like predicted oxidoreductase
MEKRRLGGSDLLVTPVCLGTMTWGVQNTEEEAHAQLDYAIKERGVNFLDTAEVYPIPSSDPKWKPGRTEEMIGTWLAKNPERRKDIVIATKVSGFSKESTTAGNRTDPPGPAIPARLDAASVRAACLGSLRRLQTDYIDLYQIHWPDRYVPLFGKTQYDPQQERDSVPIQETLGALWELIKEGKIRHYGVSNETTFGVCEWARAAAALGAPPPVSIQNSFSLLHRSFEMELAEACAPRNHNVGLLPWSPLAGGALSGKYLDASPADARFTLFPSFQLRYVQPNVVAAIRKYQAIADRAGVSLTTLALAWCKSRWYVGSTIIGATTLAQLKEDIDAFGHNLDADTLAAIDQVHLEYKDPASAL